VDEDRKPDVTGRLLEGRTGFSRAEQEDIFEDVLAQVAAEAPAPATRSWWFLALGWAAVLALVMAPVAWYLASESEPEFTARGQAANLELRCTSDACRPGESLTFELSGTSRGYLAAFARNEAGAVIWYFPEDAAGESIGVVGGLVRRSVAIGPEHQAGRWTVYAVVSDTPLTRAAVRDLFDDDGKFEGDGAELMIRDLVVK